MRVNQRKSCTLKAIFIGFILVFVNCYWTTVVEIEWGSGDGSTLPLFVYPVFIIFVVTLLNSLIKKVLPHFSLSSGELIVVYIMIVMSGTIAGESMYEGLFGSILHPIRYATPENEWKDLFFRYIPSWFTVTNKEALDGYYNGDSSLYTVKQIKLWLTPLLTWGSLTFVLVFMMLCMNVLVRKQWTFHEKLAFPIVKLPLAMTEKGGIKLFSNKIMWIGFSLAMAIDLLNGFSYLYPTIPSLPVKLTRIDQFFTEKPLNAMGYTRISFYPFAIGLGFLLPLDLSFSCWFFFVFRLAESIFGSIIGVKAVSRFPYFDEQASGAWIGLCIIAIFSSRKYLKEVFKRVFGFSSTIDDSDEPMRYRTAIFGIIAGSLFLIFFCKAASMSIWTIVLFFIIYFMLNTAIARVRAELGTPQEIYYVSPRRIMVRMLGTQVFSRPDLTIMSYFYWFNRGYTCPPMANQLEGFKMAEKEKINHKKLLFAMILAIVFAIIVSFWVNIDIRYRKGAEVGIMNNKEFIGRESFSRLKGWLVNPQEPNTSSTLFMVLGLSFMLFLTFMRMRFFWWPFHPGGYALAVSYAMDYFWLAFFISWAVKWALLKHGGIRAHRKAMPFFLGLILGDYAGGSLWAIISPVFGIKTYQIFM